MSSPPTIVTVTLNPTIDRVIEVPSLHVGGHLKGRLLYRMPAGKALNVSRAMGILGVPSLCVGFVGRDTLDEFNTAVRGMGAEPRFTPIAGASRENITLIDPAAHSETHIRDAGPTITPDELESFEAQLRELATPDAVMIFTGSLPQGLSPARYGGLIDACIRGGVRVAVDNSGEALREAVQRRLWLLKPNLQELGELVGHELEDAASALPVARKLNRRIELVAVTLGKEGGLLVNGREVLHAYCPIPPERIRSTVGCGDAFLGGFLASYCAGALGRRAGDLESALSSAVGVASASATTERPAKFSVEELRGLAVKTIHVE